MKKQLFQLLLALLVYLLPVSRVDAVTHSYRLLQDSLTEYTGKYKMQQGMQTVYADVSVENGKLIAKSSAGMILQLNRSAGDNFVIVGQNTPIKFLRNKENKIYAVALMGNLAWTKVGMDAPDSKTNQPYKAVDYLGKYEAKANGEVLVLEIAVKDDKLWATQLWDGGNSALNYTSPDSFVVNALNMPLVFKRNYDKQVTTLVLNGADTFTRIITK